MIRFMSCPDSDDYDDYRLQAYVRKMARGSHPQSSRPAARQDQVKVKNDARLANKLNEGGYSACIILAGASPQTGGSPFPSKFHQDMQSLKRKIFAKEAELQKLMQNSKLRKINHTS